MFAFERFQGNNQNLFDFVIDTEISPQHTILIYLHSDASFLPRIIVCSQKVNACNVI
jgi:hypothetical protein